MKKKNEPSEMIEILQNATVIYTDGVRDQFDAIQLTDRWIIIGRIIDDEFLDCGFISKGSIKEIKGGKKREVR